MQTNFGQIWLPYVPKNMFLITRYWISLNYGEIHNRSKVQKISSYSYCANLQLCMVWPLHNYFYEYWSQMSFGAFCFDTSASETKVI